MTLLTLAQAKSHLNMTGSTNDAELQLYVDAMPDVLEGLLGGPVEQRTITETAEVADGGRAILLGKRFVTSAATITANGASVSTSDVYVAGGSVLRRKGGYAFSLSTDPVVVVYTAGIAMTAPAALTLAAAIIAGHLWRTQRGSAGPSGPGDDFAGGNAVPGMGYAIPNRALGLMQPWAPETGLVVA